MAGEAWPCPCCSSSSCFPAACKACTSPCGQLACSPTAAWAHKELALPGLHLPCGSPRSPRARPGRASLPLCLPFTHSARAERAVPPWRVRRSRDTTPDALHMHKTLAGIADRGATTAIFECHTGQMQDGRCAKPTLWASVHVCVRAHGLAGSGRWACTAAHHLQVARSPHLAATVQPVWGCGPQLASAPSRLQRPARPHSHQCTLPPPAPRNLPHTRLPSLPVPFFGCSPPERERSSAAPLPHPQTPTPPTHPPPPPNMHLPPPPPLTHPQNITYPPPHTPHTPLQAG